MYSQFNLLCVSDEIRSSGLCGDLLCVSDEIRSSGLYGETAPYLRRDQKLWSVWGSYWGNTEGPERAEEGAKPERGSVRMLGSAGYGAAPSARSLFRQELSRSKRSTCNIW